MSLDLPYHPHAFIPRGMESGQDGRRQVGAACAGGWDGDRDWSWAKQKTVQNINNYPALKPGAPRTLSRMSSSAKKSLGASDITADIVDYDDDPGSIPPRDVGNAMPPPESRPPEPSWSMIEGDAILDDWSD